METTEEVLVFSAGCVFAAAAALLLLPPTRRRFARAVEPYVRRARALDTSELLSAAGRAAAQAAAAEGVSEAFSKAKDRILRGESYGGA